MTFTGLLNQDITIASKTGYTADGRRVVGSGTTVKARVQRSTRRRLLENRNLILIDFVAYLSPTVSINVDDKVTYQGVEYTVFSVYDAVDGSGAVHHRKLELTRNKNG